MQVHLEYLLIKYCQVLLQQLVFLLPPHNRVRALLQARRYRYRRLLPGHAGAAENHRVVARQHGQVVAALGVAQHSERGFDALHRRR